jgi:hypothetical protein
MDAKPNGLTVTYADGTVTRLTINTLDDDVLTYAKRVDTSKIVKKVKYKNEWVTWEHVY